MSKSYADSVGEASTAASKSYADSVGFARVYRSFADLGIPNSSTPAEIHAAMANRSKAIIPVSTYDNPAYGNTGLELPNALFYGLEAIRYDSQRLTLKLVGKMANSDVLYHYEGMYWNYGTTDKFTGWKRVINDADAQTITGIKTFATGATPLITDAPTTDLMAVNKAYVDGKVSANNISYFTTKEQVKEVVPNWVYKQSGSTLAWNFNTLLNNIRLAGHPRSVVCIYFDGVNAYLGNYKDKECYLTAFITEEPLNRRVEIFFPKTANTLARKDLYIGNDNDVYHDFVYQESIFVPELFYTRGDIGITTLPSGVYELRLDAKESSDSYYFTIEVNSNTTTYGSQSGVGLFGLKINCLSFKGKIDFYIDNGADSEEYKASGYFHYRKIKDLYGSNQSGNIVNWIPVEY